MGAVPMEHFSLFANGETMGRATATTPDRARPGRAVPAGTRRRVPLNGVDERGRRRGCGLGNEGVRSERGATPRENLENTPVTNHRRVGMRDVAGLRFSVGRAGRGGQAGRAGQADLQLPVRRPAGPPRVATLAKSRTWTGKPSAGQLCRIVRFARHLLNESIGHSKASGAAALGWGTLRMSSFLQSVPHHAAKRNL